MEIDLKAPLLALKATALKQIEEGVPATPFIDGYLTAINHAIDLAEVHQGRLQLLEYLK